MHVASLELGYRVDADAQTHMILSGFICEEGHVIHHASNHAPAGVDTTLDSLMFLRAQAC